MENKYLRVCYSGVNLPEEKVNVLPVKLSAIFNSRPGDEVPEVEDERGKMFKMFFTDIRTSCLYWTSLESNPDSPEKIYNAKCTFSIHPDHISELRKLKKILLGCGFIFEDV
jgi:hypothetical protein